jgi:hypothetical protein
MTIRTSELTKELVNKELQMFWKYQVDAKDIKCPLEWWGKHESLFSIEVFLALKSLKLWNPKLKLKSSFAWLGYWQIWKDVNYKQIIYKQKLAKWS